jgi:ketosteroid isomerase-like protein
MSQENVEIVRESLSAFTDGGLDALAEFWDADVSWRREYIDRNQALEALRLRG